MEDDETPWELMTHNHPDAGEDCWGTQCEDCGCCMHTPEGQACDIDVRCWNDNCGCSLDLR